MINKPVEKKRNTKVMMSLDSWPARIPDGLGLSFKDGWNFGTGFGLALVVAVPLIIAVVGCVIAFFLAVLGVSVENLYGG